MFPVPMEMPIGRKIRAQGRVSAVLDRSPEFSPAGGSQRSELDSVLSTSSERIVYLGSMQ